MAVALVVLFVLGAIGETQGVVERSRTFFGSYTVVDRGGMNELVHGTTTHGTQFQEPSRRATPTTYYSRGGPLGDVFAGPRAQEPGHRRARDRHRRGVRATGPADDFFEIDPEIVRIARDQKLFTYLADSDATIETLVGDGRLGLAKADAVRST